MTFKIGDKVKIIPNTRYSNQNKGIGTIKYVSDTCGGYEVVFEDGYRNGYNDCDLYLISKKEKKKLTETELIL